MHVKMDQGNDLSIAVLKLYNNTVIVSITLAQDEQDSSWDDEYIYTLGHEPEKMQVPQINDYNGVEMKKVD